MAVKPKVRARRRKRTLCEKRAAGRAAAAKQVAKNPAKHAAAQKKSVAKPTTKANTPKAKTAGKGKHGHTPGRPRKPC